jgi:metal-responsive CopG/Arc/MetJ family transcriptional regulator
MMNTKTAEQRKVITIRADEKLINEIDKTALALGVSRTKVIEMYLRMGLMRREK